MERLIPGTNMGTVRLGVKKFKRENPKTYRHIIRDLKAEGWAEWERRALAQQGHDLKKVLGNGE